LFKSIATPLNSQSGHEAERVVGVGRVGAICVVGLRDPAREVAFPLPGIGEASVRREGVFLQDRVTGKIKGVVLTISNAIDHYHILLSKAI